MANRLVPAVDAPKPSAARLRRGDTQSAAPRTSFHGILTRLVGDPTVRLPPQGRFGEGIEAMNVYVSDPHLLRNLQDFLRRSRCVAERQRSHELEVHVASTSEEQARRELNVYLATWQAMNPGVEAYILDGQPMIGDRSALDA
jgi:hypothetical protein